MVQTTLLIQANKDLLNRAAANITESLKEIETSDIYFVSFRRKANAKTLIGLLTLGIKKDETFEAFVISKDDVAAAIDLEKLIRAIEPYCEIISVN